MNVEEYWRMKASEAVEEHRILLQSQRDEIERLQRRCNELLHEKSMMRAATAEDIRRFCLEYQQKQIQQQNQQILSSSNNNSNNNNMNSSTGYIPIHVMMQFLHHYSAGMVPPVEISKRKRSRETTGINNNNINNNNNNFSSRVGNKSIHQQRLVQRVMARQRLRLREDEVEEMQHELEQQQFADGAR